MIMTTKKPLRTALEVYRSGYQNQYVLGAYVLGVYVLASQTFFQELRNAVCYELEHYGFCSLVDELLKEPPEYMDKVAYAVFCDLAVGYPSGQLTDVRNSDYLPYALVCVQRYGEAVWDFGQQGSEGHPACQRCGA